MAISKIFQDLSLPRTQCCCVVFPSQFIDTSSVATVPNVWLWGCLFDDRREEITIIVRELGAGREEAGEGGTCEDSLWWNGMHTTSLRKWMGGRY